MRISYLEAMQRPIQPLKFAAEKGRRILLLALLGTLPVAFCAAQRWRNRLSSDGIIYTEGGVPVNEETVKTAREIESHSTGTPNWTNEPGFEKDVFTFVRIRRGEEHYGLQRAG